MYASGCICPASHEQRIGRPNPTRPLAAIPYRPLGPKAKPPARALWQGWNRRPTARARPPQSASRRLLRRIPESPVRSALHAAGGEPGQRSKSTLDLSSHGRTKHSLLLAL